MSGTFVSFVVHLTSRLAAISGSVAFLLPDIVTAQLRGFHQFITNNLYSFNR